MTNILLNTVFYTCVQIVRYYKSTRMGRGAVIGVYNDREDVRKVQENFLFTSNSLIPILS